MEALFKRTGSEDFPVYIKGLLQGPPKSGKTSFLATCPNVVIADCEPEANGLMSIAHLNIPYVTISGTDRLQQLLFVLRDATLRKTAAEQMGMEKIETVAVDTLDALQGLLKKERLKSERRTQMQRDDWGWLKDQMAEIILGFTALPLNVIFTVHTKTTQDDDEKIITMPGLQGAIAEEVAGMVGYSMLMQRTREVRPDGIPYTKYSLKVEGDDKNPHLGNRASGRLPELVEPDFRILQKAVYDGLQIAKATVVPPLPVENTGQVAQAPVQADGPVVTESAPVAPVSDDDQPVNATALTHLSKMWGELSVPFNEALAKTWTLGDARNAVRMWVAIKQDAADGKGTPGVTPVSEMIDYLVGMGMITEEIPANAGDSAPEAAAPVTVEPKVDGTIEQVLAYIGEDLAKVQEAYDAEQKRDKPRATLVNTLINKGAKVQTHVTNDPPQQVPVPVTSVAPEAETPPTEEQVLDTVKEVLGGEVVAEVETPDSGQKPCEECGKDIDDGDIAVLSRGRFNRWLCVADYIAETRKPRATA